MAYNIIYTATFDVMQSIEPFLSVKVDIFKKDYDGDPQTITLTGTPVVHEWQDDDPFAPIKGSTCKIGIINDGTISLDNFYSNEDDTFRVEVRRAETMEALFIGYVLQDDCREIQVDFAHEIFITATDNLGLLKDVTLLEASKLYGTTNTVSGLYLFTIAGNFNTICSPDSIFGTLHTGDTFEILSGALQGVWTVTDVTLTGSFDYYVSVAESTVVYTPLYSSDVTFNVPITITGYINLLTILRLCFKASQLDLGFSQMGTIRPVGGMTNRFLEDTFILGESFIRDGSWMNCYDILEQIMQRFKASAFQAYGRWWVVRWGELYFQNGPNITTIGYQGFNYNNDFALPSATAFVDYTKTLSYGEIEYGLEKSIVRPIQYAREQFNYNFPSSLLLNADLSELGPLVNEYVSGSITIKEYTLPYWVAFSDNPVPSVSQQLIRVVKDTASGDELERYVVIKGQPYSSRNALQSNNITLGVGDVITWSFDYRTENSEPGAVNSVFDIFIDDGINPTYKIDNFGNWATAGGFTFSVASGDNLNQWHTVTIQSTGIPFECILRLFLLSASSDNTLYETHYRNFNFSVQKPNDFLKYAIGHIHRDNINLSVKNTTDVEIHIDDAPRSSIGGCLFKDTSTGILRDRTTEWGYFGYPAETGKLGYLTTLEQMMINHTARTKYDGSILKIWQGTEDNIRFFSNFFVFNFFSPTVDTRRFVPGQIALDYKHNRADLTLHQIANYGEEPADVDDYYTFTYIYENS